MTKHRIIQAKFFAIAFSSAVLNRKIHVFIPTYVYFKSGKMQNHNESNHKITICGELPLRLKKLVLSNVQSCSNLRYTATHREFVNDILSLIYVFSPLEKASEHSNANWCDYKL